MKICENIYKNKSGKNTGTVRKIQRNKKQKYKQK